MRMPADMMFIPRWLDMIRPVVPASWGPQDPAYPTYPRSLVTWHAITPASLEARSTGRQDGQWSNGWAFCAGEIKDQAQLSHEAQARRSARKARRAAEMGSRWRRTDPNGFASRNAKAQRRADKAARSMEREALARMEARQAAAVVRGEDEARAERRAFYTAAFTAGEE